ncbi:MAG: phosphoglycerate kinase [Caldisericia bacterium]|nr:phosphoglycerate kinase [Caldisericia bacterium]
MKSIRDSDFSSKTVLIRVDMNVPIDLDGNIMSESRIIASVPTLNYLIAQGAKLIVMTHFGRPKNNEKILQTNKIAYRLCKILGKKSHVKKVDSIYGEEVEREIEKLAPGQILFLENLRFDEREEAGDPEFAEHLSKLADCYVNDAFSCCHRSHASITGIPDYLPAFAGFQLEKELMELDQLKEKPKRPLVLLQGGAKVSSKIGLLKALLPLVDKMLIGGGMAFTFLRAKGYSVGKSFVEEDNIEIAQEILKKAEKTNTPIILPTDFIVTDSITFPTVTEEVSLEKFPKGLVGADIGKATCKNFKNELMKARTILFNGPMGVFEQSQFSNGTKELYSYSGILANAYKVAAGGDTAAAIESFGLNNYYSYISMGGGATLAYIEGEQLPGIKKLLEQR